MRRGLLWLPLLVLTLADASAQELVGKSPIATGTFHSSPERPDKPLVDPATGLVWSTNPSTVDLSHQASVGGRDPSGGDPTRPGPQGSEFRRP